MYELNLQLILCFFWQVSLPVVRSFVKNVTEKAVGVGVIKGVRPDQQLVKVYDYVKIALLCNNHRVKELVLSKV